MASSDWFMNTYGDEYSKKQSSMGIKPVAKSSSPPTPTPKPLPAKGIAKVQPTPKSTSIMAKTSSKEPTSTKGTGVANYQDEMMRFIGAYGTKYITKVEEFVQDPEIGLIREQLEESIQKKQEHRNKNIAALSEYRDTLTNVYGGLPTSSLVDISPVAALVDAQTGSNLASSMTKPINLQEKVAEINKIGQAINEQTLLKEQDLEELKKFEIEQLRKKDEAKAKQEILRQNLMYNYAKTDSDLERARINALSASLKTNELPNLSEKTTLAFAKRFITIDQIKQLTNMIEEHKQYFGTPQVLKRLYGKYFEEEAKQVRAKLWSVIQTVGREEEGGKLSDKDWEKFLQMYGNENMNADTLIVTLNGLSDKLAKEHYTSMKLLKPRFKTEGIPETIVQKPTPARPTAPKPNVIDPAVKTRLEKIKKRGW